MGYPVLFSWPRVGTVEKIDQFEHGMKFANVPGGKPENINKDITNKVESIIYVTSDKIDGNGVINFKRKRVPSKINVDFFPHTYPWEGQIPIIVVEDDDVIFKFSGYVEDALNGSQPMYLGDEGSGIAETATQAIEYPIRNSYTLTRFTVRAKNMGDNPIQALFAVMVQKNGSDTALTTDVTIPLAAGASSEYFISGSMSLASGDRVGVKVTNNNSYGDSLFITAVLEK